MSSQRKWNYGLGHDDIKWNFVHSNLVWQNKVTGLPSYASVKLMKLNMGPNFSFVQDNCTIHKTRKILNYLKSQNIKVIQWPPRSRDLNIIENIVIDGWIRMKPQNTVQRHRFIHAKLYWQFGGVSMELSNIFCYQSIKL